MRRNKTSIEVKKKDFDKKKKMILQNKINSKKVVQKVLHFL
jgi:hypothetical protein